MTAGQPNWQKLAHQRLTLNKELRKKAGLEERKDGLTNFAEFAAEIHQENVDLAEQIKDKRLKETPAKSEATVELKCEQCDEVFEAKTSGAAKAKLTRHSLKEHDDSPEKEEEEVEIIKE